MFKTSQFMCRRSLALHLHNPEPAAKIFLATTAAFTPTRPLIASSKPQPNISRNLPYTTSSRYHQSNNKMAATKEYGLLCLENPLLGS